MLEWFCPKIVNRAFRSPPYWPSNVLELICLPALVTISQPSMLSVLGVKSSSLRLWHNEWPQ